MKVHMLKSFWLSFLILSPALFAQAPASTIDQTRQMELRHLLKQDCGSCHGLTMGGGLGPSLRAENLVGKPVSYLAWTILNGRPGTAMPPWKALLNAEEAEWLAQVLKSGDQQ